MVKKIYHINISGEYTGDIKNILVNVNNLKFKKIKLIFTEVDKPIK